MGRIVTTAGRRHLDHHNNINNNIDRYQLLSLTLNHSRRVIVLILLLCCWPSGITVTTALQVSDTSIAALSVLLRSVIFHYQKSWLKATLSNLLQRKKPAAASPAVGKQVKQLCSKKKSADQIPGCSGCGILISDDTRALLCDKCQLPEAWKYASCLNLLADVYDSLVSIGCTSLIYLCDQC